MGTRSWIYAAVAGDVAAVGQLAQLRQEQLIAAGFGPGDLTLTRQAVLRALRDYQHSRVSDADLQRWAWFVSRGYGAGGVQGPVSGVHIDYEPGYEEAIVSVIGRFRELGDAIDGSIDSSELTELAEKLMS